MSEYLHTGEQILLDLYENVTNIFNMHASVSIETILYTWKVHVYKIEYLSRACLLERIGCALVVHELILPKRLMLKNISLLSL